MSVEQKKKKKTFLASTYHILGSIEPNWQKKEAAQIATSQSVSQAYSLLLDLLSSVYGSHFELLAVAVLAS